ncbi:MAG: C4-dicarboxylate TRAP transporter substrate-binding protein [Synergistaceae bacterium]|jgi:tripartite ATP-independent transporter DctP family solute receptor|nr:C4-dicarboxylate TRAP transporter substrate-binding protein [Synergistaceae bacterium]
MRKCFLIIALVMLSLLQIPALQAPALAAAPAAQPAVTIQLGHGNNPGSPIDLGVHKWADLLFEKSGGTMKMDVYPSEQLGSTPQLMDQMIAGDSIIVLADGAYYYDRGAKEMGILFAPYLFDTWEQCWKLIASDWYKEQVDRMASENGLQILTSNWIYGERHTLTIFPVNSVADLKGKKIRVPNNTIQIKGFEVLGAAPTPMNLGDVYTALHQGTIDGLENPVPVLENGNFQEVAKHLILDGHVRNFTTWICGSIFFSTLTPQQQQWLIDSGNEAGAYNNKLQNEMLGASLQRLKDQGVTVVEPSAEVMAGFRKAAEAFYKQPEFAGQWDGLYERIQAIISK